MDNIQYDDFDFENENRIKKQIIIQNILAVFSTILAIIYIALSVIFLANNSDTMGVCGTLWWYNLSSLLIPIELTIMMICCKCDIYNRFGLILLVFLAMVVWGGTEIFKFNCEYLTDNDFWNFALFNFIFQILIIIYPITELIRYCICSIPTPCCFLFRDK
jgi:hypothetical protein